MLACANAAVLFLARMAAREQSIATRLALGARRGQILRLGLIEPLALTAIAGAIGGCLALWVARVMIALEASGRAAYGVDATLDTRFLALTVAVTIATGVLCGVLPALWTSRRSPGVLLKAGSSLESRLVTLGRPRPGDPPDEPGTGADGVGRAVRSNRS